MKDATLSQLWVAVALVALGTGMASAHDALASANEPAAVPDAANVDFRWDQKIPLRDGVHLSATVYTPRNQKAPAPCLFTLTPYIGQSYNDRGIYFAAHGFPFLTVDVRGRGNSEGMFDPLLQEAHDGYDVVEWLAKQPYCNGKVSMWGGSYAGYDQWAAAKEFPPHLATIVPVAAPYAGVDFPMLNNIFSPYDVQWLTFTSGHTSQDKIFGDSAFWNDKNRRWFESGTPFKDFDTQVGAPSAVFQRWVQHPQSGCFLGCLQSERRAVRTPAHSDSDHHRLYDGDQPGALTHYREYMKNASAEGQCAALPHHRSLGSRRDAHAAGGDRRPQVWAGQSGGSAAAASGMVCMDHAGGPKPHFLQKTGRLLRHGRGTLALCRYLGAVTVRSQPYYLDSNSNAADVLAAGTLGAQIEQRKAGSLCVRPARLELRRRRGRTRIPADSDRSARGSMRGAASCWFITAHRSRRTPKSAASSSCRRGSGSTSRTPILQ